MDSDIGAHPNRVCAFLVERIIYVSNDKGCGKGSRGVYCNGFQGDEREAVHFRGNGGARAEGHGGASLSAKFAGTEFCQAADAYRCVCHGIVTKQRF